MNECNGDRVRNPEQAAGQTNRLTLLDLAEPCDGNSTQPKCSSYDPRDPFSLNACYENIESVAPENRGKCIDTSRLRPIHILSAEEVAALRMPPAAPGETIVANFRHNNKFYIARFPADGVSEILAQKELFNPGVPDADKLNMEIGYSAHFQARFEFNKPGKEVVLVPQDDPTNASKAIKIHNILASDEAVLREGGDNFDLLKGLHGNFAFARSFTGLQDKYQEMVVDKDHYVYQWRIKPVVNKNVLIDGKTPTADLMRQEYLRSALDLSDKDYQSYRAGHPVMYNTLHRNCISGGFEIFDRANHYPHPIPLCVGAPLFIKQMLQDRDLLYWYLSDKQQSDLKSEIESSRSFEW
jgi:hypothetical protein